MPQNVAWRSLAKNIAGKAETQCPKGQPNSRQKTKTNFIMKLIFLKASNGKYLQAEPSQNGRIIAQMDQHSPFFMEEHTGGIVYLRALALRGLYLEVETGEEAGVFARQSTATPQCQFTIEELPNQTVAFRGPDGKQYLTCQPNGHIVAKGTARNATAVFQLETAQRPRAEVTAADDVQPLWDDYTHSRIVKVATDLILKHHLGQLPVRALSILWGEKAFRDAMYRGLRDADYKDEYTGLLYKFHFYHPETQQNYMGFGNHAVDMGAIFCEKAIELGNEIFRKLLHRQRPTTQELEACGYHIGIASHFITDLTQPMHASNFANVFGDRFPQVNPKDWRHSDLEKATEDLVVDENYIDDAPAFTYDKFDPNPYPSARSILHEAAVIANNTFKNTVRRVMPDPGVAWKKNDVKKILDASIKTIGLHSVARFLSYFALQASRVEVVKPGTLYRLKGYDGRYATKDGEFIKLEPRRDTTYQEFFFISAENGRHIIVSNADRGKRAAITERDWNLGILALRLPTQTQPNESTFKLVAHGGNRIKILEFTRNELVSVKTSWPWQNHLVRWTNDEDPTNYWVLEEVGPIQLSETETEEPQMVEIATAETIQNGNSKTVTVTLNFNF
jgi:hypothetical protein